LPNMTLFDGIPSANNFDPFVPGRYARWMETLQSVDEPTADKLLDLMDVSLLERMDAARGSGVFFEPQGDSSRLRWIPCAIYAESEEAAWEQVFFGGIDFESVVVLEGAEPTQNPDCTSALGQANLQDENPNSLIISVQADSPGWLVLSDVWYPGWRVSIDGTPAQLLRANYLFRAVGVAQGNHIVQFDYRPLEFYVGTVISFVALCGYLIAARKYRLFRIFLR